MTKCSKCELTKLMLQNEIDSTKLRGTNGWVFWDDYRRALRSFQSRLENVWAQEDENYKRQPREGEE